MMRRLRQCDFRLTTHGFLPYPVQPRGILRTVVDDEEIIPRLCSKIKVELSEFFQSLSDSILSNRRQPDVWIPRGMCPINSPINKVERQSLVVRQLPTVAQIRF